jgi:hypothetical protein
MREVGERLTGAVATAPASCQPRCTRGLCQRRYEAERDFVCGLHETASEEGSVASHVVLRAS